MVECHHCGHETGDSIPVCDICAKKTQDRIAKGFRKLEPMRLPFDNYRCHGCGHIISIEQYELARYNFSCYGNDGRCLYRLSDYKFVKGNPTAIKPHQ